MLLLEIKSVETMVIKPKPRNGVEYRIFLFTDIGIRFVTRFSNRLAIPSKAVANTSKLQCKIHNWNQYFSVIAYGSIRAIDTKNP